VTVTIRGNSIHDNGALGIKTSSQNDPAAPHPNDLGTPTAAPTASRTSRSSPPVEEVNAPSGVSDAHPRSPSLDAVDDLRRRLLREPACSNFPREFLEGQTYIGSGQATTDAAARRRST
jgi:hypothetical protein